jgi:nicotinamide phosphoribosyltransferase
MKRISPLLRTDVYKLGHMDQYPAGTTSVYSFLTARSPRAFSHFPFFGLQAIIEENLTEALTRADEEVLIETRRAIIGKDEQSENRIMGLCREVGHWPVEIKAFPEGTVVTPRQALTTIRSTNPKYPWAQGFIESMLLKAWYPITTAATCFKYRLLVDKMMRLTCGAESAWWPDFAVHDFGYRSDATEWGAAISGVAHLLSFTGSDTIVAREFAKLYYDASPADEPLMLSVPASEHSVACSYGKDNEFAYFEAMLDRYPTGIVSMISDTYDLWNVLTNFMPRLKSRILERAGKCVVRPDSGEPELIICGDPSAPVGSPQYKGVIRLLDEVFGHSVNSKGFKVLHQNIGCIYGDGMYYERYERTLKRLAEMGYASSNLVVGVGGILRQGTRDTLGFAIKATYVEIDGQSREIFKDPVTDPGKKSLKGLIAVGYDHENKGQYITRDCVSPDEEIESLLIPVYRDGKLLVRTPFKTIRDRVRAAARRLSAIS